MFSKRSRERATERVDGESGTGFGVPGDELTRGVRRHRAGDARQVLFVLFIGIGGFSRIGSGFTGQRFGDIARGRTVDAGPGAFPRAGSRYDARELSMQRAGSRCHRIGLEGA